MHLVPDTHLGKIGDITVSFASLEMGIQTLIGSLINEHQRVGQIVTAELSFRNLRALAISLYLERHGEDEDYDTLKELMKQSGDIESTRNNIVHSVWGAGKDKDHITRIKMTAKQRKGLDFKFEAVSVGDLDAIVKTIQQTTISIQKLYIDLLGKGKVINSPIAKTW